MIYEMDNLSQEEIGVKLADKDIHVSTFTVRTLLKIHKFKKRKMDKCKTIKDVADRDKQFKNIEQLPIPSPIKKMT